MKKGFIYCIENLINSKKYVGKTTNTIEERWLSHKSDSVKKSKEIRPLYRAFKKYGIDNFNIFELETCSIENISERERYWISKLDTYTNGYNATLGGDGSILYDYDLIINTYKKGGTLKQTAKTVGCCVDTVSKVLSMNNIEKNSIEINYDSSPLNKPKQIHQYNLQNEYIRTFDSVSDASRWLLKNNYIKKLQSGVRGHIANCANGKNKSAYKFVWKYN